MTYKLIEYTFLLFAHYGFIYILKAKIYQRHASKTNGSQIIRNRVSCHLVYVMIPLKHVRALKDQNKSHTVKERKKKIKKKLKRHQSWTD